MLDNGAFVAGDRDTEMTAYAYPTSPHAIVAKKYPKRVAEDMLAAESVWMHKTPYAQNYDAANWRLIAGTPSTETPKNEEHDSSVCPHDKCGECARESAIEGVR